MYCSRGTKGLASAAFVSPDSDCPATISVGGTSYKNICRSLRLGFNNTLDDIRDDLWLPVCYPIAATNSLEDCSATKKCTAAGEQCLPMTIAYAGMPFSKTTV